MSITPRLDVMISGGFAYRLGYEVKIMRIFYWPTGIHEAISGLFGYRDFGLSTSVEILYRYSKRWHLSLDAGGERYLIRKITTKEQLYIGMGIGYAF